MGFVGCLEKPPNTPSTLRTQKKNVVCLNIDESFKSPKKIVDDRMISINDVSLCQTDASDKFVTPKGPNRAVVKQSSWGYIDLHLDSIEHDEDKCETNDAIKSPIARKTIRLDSKKVSAKKSKSHEEPVTAEKDQTSTHSAESLCRKHSSPVRRLVRTLSLSSTRSILSSPRRRTQLRSQLSLNKLEDETKQRKKECSQREIRKSGSFRLCATESGAVDTSTPEAALRHPSLSPKRKCNVKKQNSDSRLVSPKPKLAPAASLSSLVSPVKSRSLNRQTEGSIGSTASLTANEARDATKDAKSWDELIIEFDSITDEILQVN